MVAAHSFAYQILRERKLAAAVDRDIIYHQMVLRVMVKDFKLYFIYYDHGRYQRMPTE